jgi:hypothetical protein
MKLKPAITDGAPEAFINAVDSPEFSNRVFHRVLQQQLGVGAMGPAEFYVQKADRTVASDHNFWGCEVRLTGVSVKPGRDFDAALSELVNLYTSEIRENVPRGKKIQLFVVIMLDAIVEHADGSRSALFESMPVWVHGEMGFVAKLPI